MSALDRYFQARYHGLRAYLFAKLFLLMVALDTLLLMIGHAGRYGIAGFNVAHFSWLDRLTPLPNAELYVGILLLTALLALCAALLGTHPWSMALLCSLYTYSWSMSMLDSYQHHYFVSLILLCLVFFPPLHLHDVVGAEPRPLVRGAGFSLLGASIAVLYTYTAIAKMDPQWCQGFSLRRISRAEQVFAPLARVAHSLGIADATFWSVVSTSVIPVELLIAVGYALAVLQDDTPSRRLRRAVTVTLGLAFSLHIGAELLHLEIGWFSYYMLVLALVFLLPTRAIAALSRSLARPAAWLAEQRGSAPAATSGTGRLEPLLWAAAVSGVLAGTAHLIDLPGARQAAGIAAAGLWVFVLYLLRRGEPAKARRSALGLGFAALLMWVAVTVSPVRWDFYRYLGGDLLRRGERRAALTIYKRGERYAPPGHSRQSKIQELQRELAE